MTNWFDDLCVVDRNIYGFVVRHIDGRPHLMKEVVERKRFVSSEVEKISERNNFDFFGNGRMFGLCVFRSSGIYYVANWKPDLSFLNVTTLPEEKMDIWRVCESVGFGLKEMLEYLLSDDVGADYSSLVAGILDEDKIYKECGYLDRVVPVAELSGEKALKV